MAGFTNTLNREEIGPEVEAKLRAVETVDLKVTGAPSSVVPTRDCSSTSSTCSTSTSRPPRPSCSPLRAESPCQTKVYSRSEIAGRDLDPRLEFLAMQPVTGEGPPR